MMKFRQLMFNVLTYSHLVTQVFGEHHQLNNSVTFPFNVTEHFRNWIFEHGYDQYNFPRDDIENGGFGGKVDDEILTNDPVIFIHGLVSRAFYWEPVMDYFLSNGYKPSELYATTWGIPNRKYFPTSYYSEENVMHVRKFVEAVIQYTGATSIDIISSSMGVPLSRKVIKGGEAWDNGTYNVGPPLTWIVDTWIGIVGINYGVNECAETLSHIPICNRRNGNYPGIMVGREVVNRSEFLEDLLQDPGFEGAYRYVLYSLTDEMLKDGEPVYCQITSQVPKQTDEKVFTTVEYTHRDTGLLTAGLQLSLIQNHTMLQD